MRVRTLCLVAASAAAIAFANDEAKSLPGGPGKDLVAKVCIDCHTSGTFRKKRLSQEEWTDKVGDMVDRGAKADDKQQAEIVAYLVQNFGKGAKVNINTAPDSELIVVLGFTADESKVLVDYRSEHGPLKDWSDLVRVSGLDGKRMEAQKEKIAF